jgi:cytochrome c553
MANRALFSLSLWLGLVLSPLAARAFGLPELIELSSRPGADLESVLAALPPELASSFTLFREGHGLQQSSPSHPRAVVFSNDGRFILGFNGDEAHRGYDDLEAIGFDPARRAFEFRVISFPSKRNGLRAVQVSGSNPSVCLQCHSRDPKPNFENYPFWKGAYGQEDDRESSPEFAAFKAGPARTGRYRYLRFDPSNPSSPYRGPQTSDRVAFAERPNLRLSRLILRTTLLRDQRIVESWPALERYLFLAAALGCGHLPLEGFADRVEDRALANHLRQAIHGGATQLAAWELLTAKGLSSADWSPAFLFSIGGCPECHGKNGYPIEPHDYADGSPATPWADASSVAVTMNTVLAQHLLEDLATPDNGFAALAPRVEGFNEEFLRNVGGAPSAGTLEFARALDANFKYSGRVDPSAACASLAADLSRRFGL